MLKDRFKLFEQDRVSGQVGLGTMMMGWRLGPKESEKVLSFAYEHGIVFIDTSVSYSRGLCHEIISKALTNLKLKNQFYVATKVGGISDDSDPPEHRGYSKKNIIRQCELSLSQLKLECIDLLQLHTPPDDSQHDDVIESLSILMTQGKIRDYGICNYNEIKLKEFLTYVRENNFPNPLTCQFEYNLLNSIEKAPIFKILDSTSIKSLTWGPLAGGLLTDWYLTNSILMPNSRLDISREREQKNTLLNKPSTRIILKKLETSCSNLKISAQVFSLLWILKKNPNNLPLLGPSSVDQLFELIHGISNLANLDLEYISFDSEL